MLNFNFICSTVYEVFNIGFNSWMSMWILEEEEEEMSELPEGAEDTMKNVTESTQRKVSALLDTQLFLFSIAVEVFKK